MNWQRLTKFRQRQTGHRSCRGGGYRPRLEVLENRTLLTVLAFALEPTMSSLSLVGSTFSAMGMTVPLDEQGPGSLTTTYEGTITTDVDLDASTINFLDADTALYADISGDWTPKIRGDLGTDPANYGDQFNFPDINYSAIRDLVVGVLTNAPVALTAVGNGAYTFPSTQTIRFNDGNLDYNTTVGFGQGRTRDIVGLTGPNQAGDGALQDNGDGTFTLTVPVNASIFWNIGSGATSTFLLTGSITGTSSPGPRPPVGSHQGIDLALSLAPIAGAQSTGSASLANVLVNPFASRAVGLLSIAPSAGVAVAPSQIQDGQVHGALAQSARQDSARAPNQVAAVDAVFQDPIQNASFQDAFRS